MGSCRWRDVVIVTTPGQLLIQTIDREDEWFMKEKKKDNANIFICSRHYSGECYKHTPGNQKPTLIPGSVPTLIMPVKAFKEATHYLLDNGVKSVLSNRFCQDPLEAHFGRHRCLSSRSENPNIHTFGQQENKLRIQRDVAMKLQPKGNVEKRKRQDIPVTISNSPMKKRKH
ncbi:hypothetical protein ACOMHN_047584 [Nucella lapillus]